MRYHPYYCEENVWHLAREPQLAGKERRAVFISNAARACALFEQRAAHARDAPVVWDYHVVLFARDDGAWHVWDLDSTAGMPLPFGEYVARTFGPTLALPRRYHPVFRVVGIEELFERFCSDRTHMRRPDGSFSAPPPPWPPIGEGESTLFRFVDMRAVFAGEVMDIDELARRFGTQ